MKRYAFYFGIGLLSFSIGFIVVFFLYHKPIDKNSGTQNLITLETDKNSLGKIKIKQSEFVEIKLKDLPCEDKILKLVWDDITNETTSINTDEATKIKNCSEIIEIGEEFDLNNDGQKEVSIVSHTSPFRAGGDGYTLWIFQKIDKNNYRKIFEGIVSDFGVENSRTKEFRTITTSFRYNSAEYGYVTYKFNGEKYIPKHCWNESKLYKNKDGELVEGNKWKVRNYDCRELEHHY